MKNFIKKIIVWKLDIIAKMYLRRYKPQIIAITGNVGKTSTKEAISAVLARSKRVRSGKGNLNNEFGVPLTIVGNWADEYYEAENTLFFWIRVLAVSFCGLFFQKNSSHENARVFQIHSRNRSIAFLEFSFQNQNLVALAHRHRPFLQLLSQFAAQVN